MPISLEGDWPRLLFIADGFTDIAVASRIETAVAAGVRWVQLRDHGADDATFDRAAAALVPRLRDLRADLWLSTNRHPAVASRLGAGVHLGAHGPSLAAVRQRFADIPLIGYSAHDPTEAAEALGEGARYVTVSPIFPTGSKPGHPGIGLSALASWTAALAPAPVYALGGITPERAAACLQRGAAGVAVLSGLLHADDIAQAVRAYQAALGTA